MSEVASSFTFDVPAHGSDNPEVPLLDAAQVIELKQQLQDEEIANSVAAEIVMDSCFNPADWESRPEYQELLRNSKVREILGDAAYQAASWTHGIHEALQLPAEKWPEGMTPPGVFSEALKRASEGGQQDA